MIKRTNSNLSTVYVFIPLDILLHEVLVSIEHYSASIGDDFDAKKNYQIYHTVIQRSLNSLSMVLAIISR